MNDDVLHAFHNFTPREVDMDAISNPRLRDQIERQITLFPAMVLPDPARPAVICGIVHAHGVGEMWMFSADAIKRHARMVLKQQRALCATMYRVLGLHRMAMYVDAERVDAMRWAVGIGFRYETMLARAGIKGQNQHVYLWPDPERDKNG